jgi:hypothetical protein
MTRPNKREREQRKLDDCRREAMRPTPRATILQQEVVAVRLEDMQRGVLFDLGIRPRTTVHHPLDRNHAS